MATSSIFTNIIIEDREAAEAFITAVEKSAAFAKKHPLPKVDSVDLTTEDLEKYRGKIACTLNK